MTNTADHIKTLQAIRDEWSHAERVVRALDLPRGVKLALRAAVEEYAYCRAAREVGDGSDYDTERAVELIRSSFGMAARVQDLSLGRELLKIDI